MKEMLYIHLDAINNAVLSKGITDQDFRRALKHTPENLILLSPGIDEGEYEAHTGFRVVRRNQVDTFLETHTREKANDLKWIDFADLTLVKQLTPTEIAELLYLGHTKTHLHSPFFYKLQNKYVYLNVNEAVNKIYYRHIDIFYHVLSLKLQQMMLRKVMAEQRGWFKKTITLKIVPLELLYKLKTILQEGIVFNFEKMYKSDNTYHVPIYLIEDRYRYMEELSYTDKMLIGTLKYQRKQEQWLLDLKKN